MTTTPLSTTEVYRLVGDRIRLERSKRKLSQEDLASRIGLTRTSITNIEKGRQKMLLHTTVDISLALGIPISEILSSLDPTMAHAIDNKLPDNLSSAVKDWIVSGVKMAQKGKSK